jgi:glycosyltransferase involved in cell wall biosynthesis
MGEAIVDLLGSASLRRSMGLASRQRVIEAFDLNQAIRRYAELYSTLTNKRSG